MGRCANPHLCVGLYSLPPSVSPRILPTREGSRRASFHRSTVAISSELERTACPCAPSPECLLRSQLGHAHLFRASAARQARVRIYSTIRPFAQWRGGRRRPRRRGSVRGEGRELLVYRGSPSRCSRHGERSSRWLASSLYTISCDLDPLPPANSGRETFHSEGQAPSSTFGSDRAWSSGCGEKE